MGKEGRRIKDVVSINGKDRKSSSSHHRGHDVHRKMKEMKDREMKDFLSATDTIPNHHIKKESNKSRNKDEVKGDRDSSRKDKDKRDRHDSSKRRLSPQYSAPVADHHNDDGQPKSKIPKIKSEDNTTDPPETKKLKPSGSLDSASSNSVGKQELKMGRIPKIKTEKSDEKP